MNHPQQPHVRSVRACLLILACWLPLAGYAMGQTTKPSGKARPKRLSHQDLVARSSKHPLKQMDLKTVDDKSLSESQTAEIKKSKELMTAAESSRRTGDFAASADKSHQALDIRQKILGPKHFLTISSQVLSDSMAQWSKLTKDQQDKLAESDRQLAEAKDLQDRGLYEKGLAAAERAVSLREEVIPNHQPEIADALFRLGSIYIELSQYEKAETPLERARKLTVQVFGDSHPQYAHILDRQGWLRLYHALPGQSKQRQVNEAIKKLSGAARILLETVGENAETAESMDNLGTALALAGNNRKALRAKIRALVIRQAVLGPDAKDTGVSMTNLAWLYRKIGYIDEIIPLHSQALAIFQKQLGPEHPYSFLEMNNLAGVYMAKRQYDKGVDLFEKMVAIDEKRADPYAPGAGDRLVRLGAGYLLAGRMNDALATFSRADKFAHDLHAGGFPERARSTLLSLAGACGRHQMYADGVPYLQTVVHWDQQTRGRKDDLQFTQRTSQLGAMYMNSGHLDQAKKILKETIQRIGKLKGEGAIEMVMPLLNLVKVLEKLGEIDEAQKLCDQLVRISEAKLRQGSLGTAYGIMEMGRIYTLKGQFEMAKFSLDDARKIFDRYKDQDRKGNILILRELAHFYVKKDESDKTVELLREALQQCHDWSQKTDTGSIRIITAETLKMLLETTGAADAGIEADRANWQSELQKILNQLQKRRALPADLKSWLKK